MDSEIDYDKIVRLTNWKLQLDAQPDMSTRADFEREWGALNETERFLCKIAKSIVLDASTDFKPLVPNALSVSRCWPSTLGQT